MWFSVNLVYEGCHPGQPAEDNLWEERLILVDAASEDEAQQQAERLAKAEECAYLSATGEPVQWRFRGIERVHAIETPTLTSGIELYSRFCRASEIATLLAPFHEALAEKT